MHIRQPVRPSLAVALSHVAASCRRLDWHDPALWPPLPRWTLCALVALATALPAWMLLSAGADDDLQTARAREPVLRQALTQRLAQAAQLAPLQRQRQALQDLVAAQEQALPLDVELDALLAALHQAALRQGLQVELMRPEPVAGKAGAGQAPPIALRLSGPYPALGAFAAEVAALEPPVTLHELQLGIPARNAALTLEARAQGHRRPDSAAATAAARAASVPASASADRESRP